MALLSPIVGQILPFFHYEREVHVEDKQLSSHVAQCTNSEIINCKPLMVQATKVGSTEVHAVEAGSDEVGPPYI